MSSVCVCDWGAAKSQVILKSRCGPTTKLRNAKKSIWHRDVCTFSQGADSALPNTSSQPPTAANLPPTIVTTLTIGSIFPMDLIAMSGYNQVCCRNSTMNSSQVMVIHNYILYIYIWLQFVCKLYSYYIFLKLYHYNPQYISIYWLVIC